MCRRALPLLTVLGVLFLPGVSSAQFLDRWHEWGHGYGYGRSGFDIGKPGSAFSTPSWPDYYPDSLREHSWTPLYHYYNPIVVDPMPLPAPRTQATSPAAPPDRALIRIHVPADAQVLFDGSPTSQSGSERRFTSPALDPGQIYSYRVTARWREDGRERTETRTVRLLAGQTVEVNFLR